MKPDPEAPLADNPAQLQEEPTADTEAPSVNFPTEEELRAELEKLEQSLAFYEGYLAENRDLFVYKKTHENAGADDLLSLRLPMAFYGRMVQELELRISSLEKQIDLL